MKTRPWILLVGYLLLGLRLLHHLPAHLDAGGEDGAGEVRHIYALQVAHFLGSCGDTGGGFKGSDSAETSPTLKDSFLMPKPDLNLLSRCFGEDYQCCRAWSPARCSSPSQT